MKFLIPLLVVLATTDAFFFGLFNKDTDKERSADNDTKELARLLAEILKKELNNNNKEHSYNNHHKTTTVRTYTPEHQVTVEPDHSYTPEPILSIQPIHNYDEEHAEPIHTYEPEPIHSYEPEPVHTYEPVPSTTTPKIISYRHHQTIQRSSHNYHH